MARGTHVRVGNVLIQRILLRQVSISQHQLESLNWKVLKIIILDNEDGSSPERIATFHGAKSCSRIIYSEGHLIVKDITASNTLKVYNLNGLEKKPFLKSLSIPIHDDWKDRTFGIGPLSMNNHNEKNTFGFKTMLYYITSRKLHVLDICTGNVHTVPLPDVYKFSELYMDDETHTLSISSVKNPKSDTLMVFAQYEYYPKLKFDRILQIKKSVFGSTLVGAEINQGLLLTLHKSNKIKIYSLLSIYDAQLNCPELAPPVLLDITTFDHVLAVGSIPYHILKATRLNSFLVQSLEGDGKSDCCAIEGKENSLDSSLGFHPDFTPRLIFTDSGNFQIFDITYKDGSPSLVPGIIHSLDGYSVGNQRSPNNMTSSGRTVRRPASSDAYSRTSDNDETIHLAWDFEDDLNILGVLYARQLEGRHSHVKLTLDLLDSSSGKRLRRMELDPKIRVSSFESIEVHLRLDADRCLISIARNSRTSILVFSFVSSNSDQHL